jgi:hypothetical protein
VDEHDDAPPPDKLALLQEAQLRALRWLTAAEQSVNRAKIADRDWAALDALCRAGLAKLRMTYRPVGDPAGIESLSVTVRSRRDDRAIAAKIRDSIPEAAKISRWQLDPEMWAALTLDGEEVKASVTGAGGRVARPPAIPTLGADRLAQEFAAVSWIAKRLFENQSSPPVIDVRAVRRVPESEKDDTKSDTPKKKKKLSMTREAADCARLYREQRLIDDSVKMRQIVANYAEKHGKSPTYIMRVLNNNPDQWKT